MTLIERLEAATGPDRELDAEIAKALGWTTFMFGGAGLCWKDPDGHVRAEQPHFTSSLDAAVTLFNNLPRGLSMHKLSQPDMGGKNYLVTHQAPTTRVAARSWPLALCIAALRARGVK